MRAGQRLELRVGITGPANAANGSSALLEGGKAAICRRYLVAAVLGAPRIVLRLRWCAGHHCHRGDKCQAKERWFHRRTPFCVPRFRCSPHLRRARPNLGTDKNTSKSSAPLSKSTALLVPSEFGDRNTQLDWSSHLMNRISRQEML